MPGKASECYTAAREPDAATRGVERHPCGSRERLDATQGTARRPLRSRNASARLGIAADDALRSSGIHRSQRGAFHGVCGPDQPDQRGGSAETSKFPRGRSVERSIPSGGDAEAGAIFD